MVFWPGNFSADGTKLAGELNRFGEAQAIAIYDLQPDTYRELARVSITTFGRAIFLGDDRHAMWFDTGVAVIHDLTTGGSRTLFETPLDVEHVQPPHLGRRQLDHLGRAPRRI